MVTKIDIAVVVLLCEHQALDLLIKKKTDFLLLLLKLLVTISFFEAVVNIFLSSTFLIVIIF